MNRQHRDSVLNDRWWVVQSSICQEYEKVARQAIPIVALLLSAW